jgi:hypothetical protein
MRPEVTSPFLQKPPLVTILSPINLSQPIYLRFILVSSHLHLGLPCNSLPSSFPKKFSMNFSLPIQWVPGNIPHRVPRTWTFAAPPAYVACRGTNLCFYICMPAWVPVCLFVCELNKSFTVRLIAKHNTKMVVLWGEFYMVCDFYHLIYPDLLSWMAWHETAKFLLDVLTNHTITYSHAADNGVARLSNRSACDQPPKRPPALKKRGQRLATLFITVATC